MTPINFKELKEVEKQVLKGISLIFPNIEPKTIAGFDVSFFENKAVCSVVVLDLKTLEVLEKKHTVNEEIMPYNPNISVFREAPPIIETLKQLENQPDTLLIDGAGALHANKAGVASYVGVLVNKPTIGLMKELMHARLEEDKIMVNNEQKGTAVRLRPFANPIYITPGHNMSMEKAVELVKQVAGENKLPLPLHLAHKITIQVKKELKELRGEQENGKNKSRL